AGVAGLNVVQEATVDLVDNLQVPRQHQLEQLHRPLLQGFGQQRVVGIGKRLYCEVPGFVPTKVSLVQKNAHQLGDGEGRVRVVELDGHLVGQGVPVAVAAAEAGDNVGQRTGNQKVLLAEAQPLA